MYDLNKSALVINSLTLGIILLVVAIGLTMVTTKDYKLPIRHTTVILVIGMIAGASLADLLIKILGDTGVIINFFVILLLREIDYFYLRTRVKMK